jgi:hypothetical protein
LAISLLSDFGLVYLLAPSTTRPPPVTGTYCPRTCSKCRLWARPRSR